MMRSSSAGIVAISYCMTVSPSVGVRTAATGAALGQAEQRAAALADRSAGSDRRPVRRHLIA